MGRLLRRRVVKVALLVAALAAAVILYNWATGLMRQLSPTYDAQDRAAAELQRAPTNMTSALQRQRTIFRIDSTRGQIARDLDSRFGMTFYRPVVVRDGRAEISAVHFADGFSGGGLWAGRATVRMCVRYEVDLRSRAVTPSGETCPAYAPYKSSHGPQLADTTIDYQPDPNALATSSPAAPDLGVPPNHVDNNSWKQRRDPTPADLATAQSAEKPLRQALERQRAAGAVDPATTKQTVRKLGYPDERAYIQPWGTTTDPVGTIIAIHVGDTACLIATIRAEGVQVSAKGMNSEFHFSCLEPRTH